MITFQAQGMVPDSIEYKALESIYTALDGDNWYDNDNWLSGSNSEDFSTWYGLTVIDGDVVGIDLSYNNLSGEIPSEFCQLRGLSYEFNLTFEGNRLTGSYPAEYGNLGGTSYMPPELYLSNNNLTYLQQVTGDNYIGYTQLWIQYNQIEFSQLEQHAGQWHGVIYSPQNEIGEADTLEVINGSQIQIGSLIGGQYTSWQWQKLVDNEWQNLTGKTDSAIVFSEFDASHEGIYRCVATNTEFSDLTLYTANTTLLISDELITAIADGNWNDPSIWEGLPAGTYPNRNHIISISGHAVTVGADFETGDIILNNAEPGTELIINGGHLQVFGTVKVQNVNPDNKDCKLEVTGSGKISVLNVNQ